MIKIEVPNGFDVNFFEVLATALDSHIKTGGNIIGSSGVSFCKKAKIIELLLKKIGTSMPFYPNSKMLFGEVFEEVVYIPKVLSSLIYEVNNALNIQPDDQLIITQAQKFIDMDTGKSVDINDITDDMNLFRVTPDIYTSHYMIEVKTTGVYAREWKKELAAHQVVQLNCQLGAFGVDLGFILKVNSRAFISNIKEGDDYWTRLWNSYGYLIPWHFDKKLYDETLKRVKSIFDHVKAENYNVQGPEIGWECRYCGEPVRELCGKAEYKCTAPKCTRKMYEYKDQITDQFKGLAMCEKHFKEYNPHSKYEKFKFKVKK